MAHGDAESRRHTASALAGAGCIVLEAAGEPEAARILDDARPLALVVVDADDSGSVGLRLLKRATERHPQARRVVCATAATYESHTLSRVFRAWLLLKPVPTEALRALAKSVSSTELATLGSGGATA